MPASITVSQWAGLGIAGLLLWADLTYGRDGGFTTYGPPRYRPDLLKKQREANPPPEPEDLSKRFNKIPGHSSLLAIDYENLYYTYGIK